MIRHRDVVLSPEEAARFDDDQRENLRSWGIGVPEPIYPDDPDEPPLKPNVIRLDDLSPFPRYMATAAAPYLTYLESGSGYWNGISAYGSATCGTGTSIVQGAFGYPMVRIK